MNIDTKTLELANKYDDEARALRAYAQALGEDKVDAVTFNKIAFAERKRDQLIREYEARNLDTVFEKFRKIEL